MSLSVPSESSPQRLLIFYEQQFAYYHRWALLHRCGYWMLLWILLGNATFIAGGLLIKADSTVIAGASLLLNVFLFATRFIDSETKWARYRTTEIRIAFALQAMRTEVSRQIALGGSYDAALLSAMPTLHDKVESLVMEEFDEYFRQVKSLNEINTESIARSAIARS